MGNLSSRNKGYGFFFDDSPPQCHSTLVVMHIEHTCTGQTRLYNAKAPTIPATIMAPAFLAMFATAAPVETTVEAVAVAWNVAVALGTTVFERTALVEAVDQLDAVTLPEAERL